MEFVCHGLEQRVTIPTEIGDNRESNVIAALTVQRNADGMLGVFIVWWYMAGCAVPFMEFRALRGKFGIERLVGRATYLAGEILCRYCHLLI